jgi:hypothetical protein
MATEIKRIYQNGGYRDYSIYPLATILKVGEKLYFNNIISGQIKPGHSVTGDGVSQINALPFDDELKIVTSSNVVLTGLRIDGNDICVLNTNSVGITVDIGTGGSPDLFTVNPGDKVGFCYGNGKWNIQFPSGSSPIGAVIGWHKDFANTPSLYGKWVECNGQVLSEPLSPYDGQTLPDLNGDERFLRGGATSGILQADSIQGHWHRIRGGTGAAATLSAAVPQVLGQATFNQNVDNVVRDVVEDTINGYGSPRVDTETRPINMSVVWIIRVY